MKKFLIFIIIVFVLLRLPSLFEGLWYADEGFYAVGADSILNGGKYYIDAWDHKPPMMVWIYMLGSIFGWGLGYPIIKILSIFAGIASIYLLYLLFQKFKIADKWQKVGLTVFIFLIGTPYLDGNVANAELFFMPIALAVLYLSLKKQKAVIVGLLATISFLIKPQAFLEVSAILILVGIYHALSKNLDFKYFSKILASFFLSMFVFLLYQFSSGTLYEFYDAVFKTNFGYSSGGIELKLGYLFFAVSTILLSIKFAKDKKIAKEVIVLLGLYLANLFLASLSGRGYQHYLLQLVPIAVLLFGYFMTFSSRRFVIKIFIALVVGILSLGYFYQSFEFLRPQFDKEYYISYYWDFPQYLAGKTDTSIWFWKNHDSFDAKEEFINYFNEEYTGVEYYYYGEDPWIFAQLDAKQVNKYLVWYHLTFTDEKLQEGLLQRDNALVLIVDKRSPVYLDGFFDNLDTKFTLIEVINDFEIYANNEK